MVSAGASKRTPPNVVPTVPMTADLVPKAEKSAAIQWVVVVFPFVPVTATPVICAEGSP